MLGDHPLMVLAQRNGLGGLDESPRAFGKFLDVHVCPPFSAMTTARLAAPPVRPWNLR